MSEKEHDRNEKFDKVASVFAQKRYFIIRKLINDSAAKALCSYILRRSEAGALRSDVDVPLSFSAYADRNMEKLLLKVKPVVEKATGLELFPVYSYTRLYNHGAELGRHCDRDACEISLSINLGQDPPRPWILWIRNSENPFPAELLPGDALLYRGIECEHWRDPFPGNYAVQVFLHYVDRNGPYAMWKFDKRESINHFI